MKSRSVAGKLISLFVTSLVVSIYFILDDSEGFYKSLFLPAYFIVFAFSCFVSFPTSLLIDKVASWTRNIAIKLIIYLLLGLLGLGLAAIILTLIGLDLSTTLVLYGIVSSYLFFVFDYLIAVIERKGNITKDTKRDL